MSRTRLSILIFSIGVSAALLWGYVQHQSDNKPLAEKSRKLQPPLNFTENKIETGSLVRREVMLMGALFNFTVEAEAAKAGAALDAVIQRLHRLENEISVQQQQSDIHKLNAKAGIAPVKLGKDAFALLDAAKHYCQETGNAFDVTSAPLWNLYPFNDPVRQMPTQAELDQARKLVNCTALQLDSAAHTAFLPIQGMAVDLNALGKAYAAQLAGRMLAEQGISRAAIQAGESHYLHEPASSGAWTVEIPNPGWPGHFIERFTLANSAVATLNNNRHKLVRAGKTYGSIVDPRTGQTVTNVQSVTVVAADAVAAEAYATAVAVMGPVAGMQWVEAHPDVQALIVDQNGEVLRSSGWAKATSRPATPVLNAPTTPEAHEPEVVIRGGRLTPTEPGKVAIQDFSALGQLNRMTPELPEQHSMRPLNRATGEMVSVPGGDFIDADRHKARTRAFHIDRTEVTNRAYRLFLDETKGYFRRYCHPDEPSGKDHIPLYWKDDWQPPLLRQNATAKLQPFDLQTFRHPDDPVVGVDWWDAYCYANWAGKRLPSRDEWVKAAGGNGRRWPWGDRWNPKRANVGGEMNGELDGYTYAAPAHSFAQGASPYGILHMVGNVAEWTAEGWVMGGSSRSTPSGASTTAFERKDPGYRSFDVGIRAAR